MTTHWIIAIGSPKLPVMSGKAMLTAVSSGTTEMPRPTSTSRSHGQATTGAAAALPFTAAGIASSGYRARRIDARGNRLPVIDTHHTAVAAPAVSRYPALLAERFLK